MWRKWSCRLTGNRTIRKNRIRSHLCVVVVTRGELQFEVLGIDRDAPDAERNVGLRESLGEQQAKLRDAQPRRVVDPPIDRVEREELREQSDRRQIQALTGDRGGNLRAMRATRMRLSAASSDMPSASTQ